MISNYEIVYAISNALGVYAIYLFLQVFYSDYSSKPKRDFLLFGAFYILNISIYLIVNIPIVVMAYNLIGMFLLGLSKERAVKKAMLSAMYVYIILVVTEILVVLASNYIRLPVTDKHNYSIIWGVVAVNIINYILVLIIRNYIKAKRGVQIPTSYWLALVFMPAGSLYILVGIIGSRDLSTLEIAVATIIILGMNFITFYLYDVMGRYYEAKTSEAAVLHLNRCYINQFDTINKSSQIVRAFRHDMRKHMAVVLSILESGETIKARDYIGDMTNRLDNKHIVTSTGNLVIDSIVNFELEKAVSSNVQIDCESDVISTSLSIADYDMTIVLSNLLSNAIRATMAIEENRRIKMLLKYRKGMFYIYVENTFDGNLIYNDDTLLTNKKDKKNHGIGMGILKKTLQKYGGDMKINHEGNLFIVEAFMYI